jgi:steroid 5-alpha reductase family enzyme
MFRTMTFLVLSLPAIAAIAYYFDAPLTNEQWAAVSAALRVYLGVALVCFITAEITRNYSQVDKVRTLIAVYYVWYFAAMSGWNERMVWMATLTIVWSARLTYNLMRRGGFSWVPWGGKEDYRWVALRARTPAFHNRWVWGIFNLMFIALYRNALVFMFISPIIVAWQGATTPLGILDYLAIAGFLGFVWMQAVADNQQYRFQTQKHEHIKTGMPLNSDEARGFLTTGLWAKMRHPNYTAEQGIWWCFYLFSVAATGRWINWSMAGPILLMILFVGSADYTEQLSGEKYPEYADYQKRVQRFLPNKYKTHKKHSNITQKH